MLLAELRCEVRSGRSNRSPNIIRAGSGTFFSALLPCGAGHPSSWMPPWKTTSFSRFDGLKRVDGPSKLGDFHYVPVLFHEGGRSARNSGCCWTCTHSPLPAPGADARQRDRLARAGVPGHEGPAEPRPAEGRATPPGAATVAGKPESPATGPERPLPGVRVPPAVPRAGRAGGQPQPAARAGGEGGQGLRPQGHPHADPTGPHVPPPPQGQAGRPEEPPPLPRPAGAGDPGQAGLRVRHARGPRCPGADLPGHRGRARRGVRLPDRDDRSSRAGRNSGSPSGPTARTRRRRSSSSSWPRWAGTTTSVVFCYGGYERAFLKRMRKTRQAEGAGGPGAGTALVNVLSVVYAHVYFPCHSNGLKDVAGCLGCSWTDPDASGLQSMVWRKRWEATQAEEWKQKLVTYNLEDCCGPEAGDGVPPRPRSGPDRARGRSRSRGGATRSSPRSRNSTDWGRSSGGGGSTSSTPTTSTSTAVPGSTTSGSGSTSAPASCSKKTRRKPRPAPEPEVAGQPAGPDRRPEVPVVRRYGHRSGGHEGEAGLSGISTRRKRAFDLVFTPGGIKRKVIECQDVASTSAAAAARCSSRTATSGWPSTSTG